MFFSRCCVFFFEKIREVQVGCFFIQFYYLLLDKGGVRCKKKDENSIENIINIRMNKISKGIEWLYGDKYLCGNFF